MRRKRNSSCVYTGAVGARMRVPLVRPTRALNRAAVQLIGGPLNGCKVRLDGDAGFSTLPLAPMHGFGAGRYIVADRYVSKVTLVSWVADAA